MRTIGLFHLAILLVREMSVFQERTSGCMLIRNKKRHKVKYTLSNKASQSVAALLQDRRLQEAVI